MTANEWITIYPEILPPCLEQLEIPVTAAAPARADAGRVAAIETLMLNILAAVLHARGMIDASGQPVWARCGNLPDYYRRWFAESFRVLTASGLPLSPATPPDLGALWAEWQALGAAWRDDADVSAQMRLVETCLRALPELLAGTRKATDVLFPDSSMALVEGIYKGNALADLYNTLLGDTVTAYVRRRLAQNPEARLRILEIGAGTGGTTAGLIVRLRPFQAQIAEYCYTDLSKAFLIHAETHYASDAPYLRTHLFDAAKPVVAQGIAAGGYDLVIAANVLHATRDIRLALRNAKACLRKHGLLVLNELSANSLFAHLTFGLLEGWWLYEDEALRIPGCPGLYPESWAELLAEEGFGTVRFPAGDVHAYGQQIIAAESDGMVRQIDEARPSRVDTVVGYVMPTRVSPTNPDVGYASRTNSTTISDALLRAKTIAYLKGLVATTLKMPADQLDAAQALETYGLDSILVVQLTNTLHKSFEGVTSTLFFEVQTLDALAWHLLKTQKDAVIRHTGLAEVAAEPAEVVTFAKSRAKKSGRFTSAEAPIPQCGRPDKIPEVAIIGLSGRYPKAADVDEFWTNLIAGKHCITEIPEDRWAWQDYFDMEKGREGRHYSKWGGFIDDVDKFDPLFFRISPRDAERMDPQERLFLETAYACIEDAGYTPETLCESRKIGVFVGVMNSLYAARASHWSIANRVSYTLDFQGPSLAVDSACSSSLSALHLALESLYSGTSECALAGGVNLILDPSHYQLLSEMTMLSADDRCRSFGADADGFVDGEGVGAVLLKPLHKAIADRDQIHGIIKASMLNAGGKTNGYTVPNPHAQTRLIAEALQRAGVHPRAVSYLEAHGTGTVLGDPIEIAGLARAFAEAGGGPDKQYCALGSVKANIGHGESAAGIAGITKVLLQMRHGRLAPSIDAEALNPLIAFNDTPFVVQRQPAVWQRPVLAGNGISVEYPRIAGVSSFGAGGSNAHVVLQEYIGERGADSEPQAALMVLSAKNEERLKEVASRLGKFINVDSGRINLADLAYTLQQGRVAMEERLAFIAGSLEALSETLQAFVSGREGPVDVYRGRVTRRDETPVDVLEDIDALVDACLNEGHYGKLLALWVQGRAFDWNRLYPDGKPYRIPLPTYPFARERYWLSDNGLAAKRLDKAGTGDQAPWDGLSYLPVWVRQAEIIPELKTKIAETILVVSCASSSAFTQTLRDDLLHRNAAKQVIGIQLAFETRRLSDSEWSCGVDDVAGFATCLKAYPEIGGVFFVATANGQALVPEVPAQSLHDHQMQLLRLVKYLKAATADNASLDCYVLTEDNYRIDAKASDPRDAGLTGLAYAIAQSDHRFKVRNLDLSRMDLVDHEKQQVLIEHILAEPATDRGEVIKLQSCSRYRQVFRKLDSRALPRRSALKQRGVYVILGGGGTVGRVITRYLLEDYQAKVIWIGRSAESDPGLKERLAGFGGAVEYVRGDATRLDSLQQALARIKEKHPVLNGAVFSGIVFDFDNSLAQTTEARFAEIFDVKTQGSVNFYSAFRHESLDFMCYFSSGQAFSFSGAASLSAYAAGITFSDSFVRSLRNASGFPVGTINWGFWQASLAATNIGENVGGLRDEEGFRCFERFVAALEKKQVYQVLCMKASESVRELMAIDEQDAIAASHPERSSRADAQPKPAHIAAQLKQPVAGLITDCLSAALKIQGELVDPDTAFSEYGMDSVVAAGFVKQVGKGLNIKLNSAIVFDYATVNRLAKHVIDQYRDVVEIAGLDLKRDETGIADSPDETVFPVFGRLDYWQQWQAGKTRRRIRSVTPAATAGIAVIGIAGQFPGAADVAGFWQNLVDGHDGVTELPEHYRVAEPALFAHQRPDNPGYRWGGVLAQRDCFDPLFFNIAPREAESMSPHQRLILQESWKALEDAGINPKSLDEQKVGLFIGAEPGTYVHESFTGASDAIIASRLSYFLNLKGPALVVNTGCSSSAAAIHLACESLRHDESSLAVAGGVFAEMDQAMLMTLADIDMLSPSGRCHAFDARADGTAFSEGVGVVVLKRLVDAVADGDPIYGVIEASGLNQDGASNGMTAPNGIAQEALISDLYRRYRIDPEHIGYVEAHGTGTKLGDPVEANALVRAFRRFTGKRHYCALGSAKAHIGHTSASAGVIGLIKILLSIKHRKIPGLLHFQRLNPLIEFADSAFYVNPETKDWPVDDGRPLKAALNSFGHSGTNVHLVVGAHVETLHDNSAAQHGPCLIVLSAKNAERLREYAGNLLAFIGTEKNRQAIDLTQLAYTLQTGREAMEERLAFTALTLLEVEEKLVEFLADQRRNASVYRGQVKRNSVIAADFADDEDIAQTVRAWLDKGKYDKLLSLWVQGFHLDWKALYGNAKPRRMHLPSYPFALGRYWAVRADAGQNPARLSRAQETVAAESADGREACWDGLAYLVKWQEQPGLSKQPQRKFPETVLVVYTPSSQPFEQIIADACRQRHPDSRIVQIRLSSQTSELSEHHWQCDTAQGYSRCLQAYPAIDSVYFVATDEGQATMADAEADIEIRWLRLIRSLQEKTASNACIDFYLLTSGKNVHGAGLTGLVYALAQGDHRFLVRNLVLSPEDLNDPARRQALPDLICAEEASDRGDAVRLEAGLRYRQSFFKLGWTMPDNASALKTGGVYLILGGAGSVGRVLTRYLLERYQACVIWIGRTEESDATVQEKLALCRGTAGSLSYFKADATRPAAMREAVARIKQRYPAISGAIFSGLVFHHERALAQLTEAEFSDTLAIKKQGGVNFYHALQHEALDFMCYFSSVQAFSFLSAKDSAAYAAGIVYSDAFVESLQGIAGFPVGTINWGYWADTTAGTGLEKRLGNHYGLISDAEGCRFFDTFCYFLQQGLLHQALCLSAEQSVRELMACADDEVLTLCAEAPPSLIQSLWGDETSE